MDDGPAPAPPPRRPPRDRAVDAALFCAAVLLGMVLVGVAKEQGEVRGWAAQLDPLLGLAACLALWWRRRFPLAVGLVGLPAVALATSALAAGAVIVANLALRLRRRDALVMLGAYTVCMVPSGLLLPGAASDLWFDAGFSLMYLSAAFTGGYGLRARRELLARLREDAHRARAEHERRLADARRGERKAIAREMHDVLAHRVSLLSVHAGALVYRTRQAEAGVGPALSAAEVVESAEVIRGNAHEALEELREVLALLRADDGGGDPVSLLPRIEGIGALVTDARATGQAVDFRIEMAADTVGALRPQLHRTAYRVAQEGLTNARKHAPGRPVSLRLAGGPGSGLTVEVRNELPTVPGPAGAMPGAGAGLVGLAERIRLDGGVLEHVAAGGTFALRARLPWPEVTP